MQVNVYEAKAKLSALLDKALACLTPVAGAGSNSGVRLGGLKRARVKLAADFHAPPADDDLLGR